MRGPIRARGQQSWELKFEAGKRDATGSTRSTARPSTVAATEPNAD
jgi:hypothetical protein